MSNTKEKIYFPNLDGLRAIAALLVVFVHIPQLVGMFKIGLYNPFEAVADIQFGKFAVAFFFALSGFLITFLMLKEEERNKSSINIKLFYAKRVLRIWPIYYLMVFLSFFVLPNLVNLGAFAEPTNDWKIFTLFMIFFSNVASTYDLVIGASHLWTIGIEEQFYLLWPLFFLFVKKQRMMKTIVLYVFLLILRGLCYNHCPDFLFRFNSFLYISCLIGGSIFAFILFEQGFLLKLVKNKFIFLASVILVFVMLFFPYSPYRFDYERFTIPFGIIIINLGTMRNTQTFLELKFFKHLGRISYGIYVYHVFVLTIVIFVLRSLGLLNNIFLYGFSFGLSILVSHLSFKYFESPILKLKKYFSV